MAAGSANTHEQLIVDSDMQQWTDLSRSCKQAVLVGMVAQ